MRSFLVLPLVLTCCAYNFEDYTPRGDARVVDTGLKPTDGSADTAIADTASVDTSCALPGGDTCLPTAKSCSATCAATRAACEAACSKPNCPKACVDSETSCKSKCVSDCTACTTTAGCASPARCATEVG